MNVNVQFSDSTQTKVVAVFGCPQDPLQHPNQGVIQDTDPRYMAFANPPTLKLDAQSALDKSDMVSIRCLKAGVAFPAAWQTYVASLRAIVNGSDTTSTVLPPAPAYPAGT